MKKYTIKLEIYESGDEFWESLEGKSGCDEVLDAVTGSLNSNGFFFDDDDNNTIKLIKFEDEEHL